MEKFAAQFNQHPLAISFAIGMAVISITVLGWSWWVTLILGSIGFFIGRSLEKGN